MNFLFKTTREGNTLLHYVRTISDLDALLENGFKLVNQQNDDGRSALMRLGGWERPGILRKLLDIGADINLRNVLGQTAMESVLEELKYELTDKTEILQTLCVYLDNGVDCLSGDDSRCPCSPNGCYQTKLLWHFGLLASGIPEISIWSFEARHILLSFIRRARHKELGMVHVCICHWENL